MRSPKITKVRAKRLRKEMTPPEALLWVRLRVRAPGTPTFRRQHAIGDYILDFFCATAKLAIEVDGQSHGMGDRPERDVRRERYLTEQGIRVMRYPAELVMRDPNGVAQAIFEAASG